MTFIDDRPTDWRTVIFGVSLGALAAFQQFKLPPALPLLIGEFAYSKTLAGSYMSIYALAGLIFSMPAGRALSRRGPMGLLTLAFCLMLFGNAIGLALPQYGYGMLMGRLFEAVGFSILAVVGAVIATASASLPDRPVAVALWAMWIPIGQIISTLIAIPTVSVGLWRPLWGSTVAATALLWIVALILRRKGAHALTPPPSVEGRPAKVAPLNPKHRTILLIAAAMFGLWSGQYITYVTWLPQYLVESLNLAPGTAAKAYLVPCVTILILNPFAARWLKRGVGLGTLILVTSIFQLFCWILIPYTTSTVMGLISLAVYGGTSGITATAIFSLPGTLLGPDAPRGFAAMMTGRNMGVLVGPVLLAQIVTRMGNWTLIPPVFAAACGAVAILGVLVARGLKDLKKA